MNFEKYSFHSVLQGPNRPLKNWPPPLIVTSLTSSEFCHLKLVKIPITTVLFLIKTWLSHSLTHSLTLTLTLTHLLKLHQLILEIYQVVYLLYLWNYVNSHISANYISHMIYIKTKSSHWELFWKKGILKFVVKTLEKYLWRSSLFSKVAGFRPATKMSSFKGIFEVFWS